MVTPLEEIRKSLGLNQRDFGKAAKASQQLISVHEQTGRGMSLDKILRLIAKYRPEMEKLGLTAEEVIRGSRTRGKRNGGRAA